MFVHCKMFYFHPVGCPNRGFCAQQPSAVPCGGGVLVVAGVVSVVRRYVQKLLRCDVVTSGEM